MIPHLYLYLYLSLISILGPLLFLIYINDLPKAVEPAAIPIMFADDTSIIIKSLNNTQLQSDLNAAVSNK